MSHCKFEREFPLLLGVQAPLLLSCIPDLWCHIFQSAAQGCTASWDCRHGT